METHPSLPGSNLCLVLSCFSAGINSSNPTWDMDFCKLFHFSVLYPVFVEIFDLVDITPKVLYHTYNIINALITCLLYVKGKITHSVYGEQEMAATLIEAFSGMLALMITWSWSVCVDKYYFLFIFFFIFSEHKLAYVIFKNWGSRYLNYDFFVSEPQSAPFHFTQ